MYFRARSCPRDHPGPQPRCCPCSCPALPGAWPCHPWLGHPLVSSMYPFLFSPPTFLTVVSVIVGGGPHSGVTLDTNRGSSLMSRMFLGEPLALRRVRGDGCRAGDALAEPCPDPEDTGVPESLPCNLWVCPGEHQWGEVGREGDSASRSALRSWPETARSVDRTLREKLGRDRDRQWKRRGDRTGG